MTFPSSQSNTTIRWIALISWVLIVVANLIYYVVDLATDYADMLVPCTGMLGSGGDCNFLAISSAEMAVLVSWGLTPQAYATGMTISPIILLVVFWTLAGLILWRQYASWLGLTVSLALVVLPVATVSGDNDWSGTDPLLFVLALAVAISGTMIVIVFLYLIPNGRFAPKWAYIPLAGTLILVSILLLKANGVLALPAPIFYWLQVIVVGLVLFGGGLQIYRYFRASTAVERQQTKWIIVGILAYVLSVVVWVLIFGGALSIPAGQPRLLANLAGWTFMTAFSLLILPAAITIAILRCQLWNIDVVLNRALVYAGLTLGIVLIYVLTVAGLGFLFQTSGNVVISLVATGLVAVAFNPVRERLQRGVNRLMYGQRDDPYAVLSQVGQQLQRSAVPGETLTSIVETIAVALKLPFVAVELEDHGEQIGRAAVGEPVTKTVELSIRYQNETVGRLLVSPRAGGEQFTPQEEQLLADIAAQTGLVASATRLNLALQHSREQLVLAREEERRRIRRDLHDGLGPTLASQTLQLDLVLDSLAENDAHAAGQQVRQLKRQTQQMVADIRRLVYELRPPALDELGLLEAMRAHVAQMDATNGQLRIAIVASPEPLPPLPAAIEVAAYRIALEGMTNVIRHAGARNCDVRFDMPDDKLSSTLILSITDNGVGLPDAYHPGVGLISMRERAEELGGACAVGPNQSGGTRVTATLPFTTRGER